MSSVLSVETPLNGDSRMLPASGEVADLEAKRQQKRQEGRQDNSERDKGQYGSVLAEYFQELEDRSTIFGQKGLPDWVKKGCLIDRQANVQMNTKVHPSTGVYLQAYIDVVSLCEAENGFEDFAPLIEKFLKDQEVLADAIYDYASRYIRPEQLDPPLQAIFGAALAQLAWDRAQCSNDKNTGVNSATVLN